MKPFAIKHRYKRYEIIKIIKRHLYIKKPLQELLEYTYEGHKKDMEKCKYDLLIKGFYKIPNFKDETE